MSAFLARISGTFAILCGVLFIYGFLMVDNIRVSTLDSPTAGFDVMVTLKNITPRYAWVEVYGCAAEMREDGVVICAGAWDRTSIQQTREDVSQYPFFWGRYVPKGTLLIVAHAMDANGDILARGRTVVMR